ncbi:YveK family protein [Mesobacillus jeotgali]|uniref:YveK family protein n=1 Tax=Mesobacillus jeotgali TaxID=129985 RepID=UPI0009A7AB2A|nr:Wzz/FepE/Etk N-terminal domain-containing protein [Mesobacillus jeotgali]
MEEVTLKDLYGILRKRILLILSLTLTAVIMSAALSYFYLTPIYQASTQILVNQAKNDQERLNAGDVQNNLQYINTYNVIIKSPAILNLVIEELNLKATTAQLNDKIHVSSQQNSQVVNISVQDSNIDNAVSIANTTAKVFQEEITKIMNVNNVSILAEATVTEGQSPIKPKPLINIAIALIIGLMTGIGLAFLLDYLDNTIKNEQEIESILGLPVLGVIAAIDDSELDFRDSKRKTRNKRTRGENLGH